MIPVKAAAGMLVRHPHTRQPLPLLDSPDEPVNVEESELYWARLLRDGDVVPVKPAPAKARGSSSKGDQA